MHRHFKKNLTPSREFLSRTEARFLAQFRTEFPAHYRSAPRAMRYAFRAFAAVTGFMLALGGGAFYADAANVSPTNVLYPLKRSKEAVQLAFTPKVKQAEFHLTLAEKRLEELVALSANDDTQVQLAISLAGDFRHEVSQSVGDVEIENESEEKVIAIIDLPRVREKKDIESEARKQEDAATSPVTISSGPASLAAPVKEFKGGDDAKEDDDENTEEMRRERTDEEIRTLSEKKESEDDEKKEEIAKFCEAFTRVIRRAHKEAKNELATEEKFVKKAEKKCGSAVSEALQSIPLATPSDVPLRNEEKNKRP